MEYRCTRCGYHRLDADPADGQKVKDTTSFQRQEQSIQLKSLLNIGQNYAKNILSFLLKTVLMKKIGKDGRNLQTDLVTRFS